MIDAVIEDAVERLRHQGAVFAFLPGSQLMGTATAESDVEIAAWFVDPVPTSGEVDLAPGTDLLVLNSASLEMCGRVALDGELILDDDPPARVHWVAQTRKIYSDEKYRIHRSHAEFLAAVREDR